VQCRLPHTAVSLSASFGVNNQVQIHHGLSVLLCSAAITLLKQVTRLHNGMPVESVRTVHSGQRAPDKLLMATVVVSSNSRSCCVSSTLLAHAQYCV
jgi:hypothetical protein